MKKYVIYGSGDAGSAELVAEFEKRSIPYEFRDLRTVYGQIRTNLVFAMDRGFRTVPQVFSPDGSRIGNFTDTMKILCLRAYP